MFRREKGANRDNFMHEHKIKLRYLVTRIKWYLAAILSFIRK